MRLGLNIDHIATLRQARGTRYPDPLEAAFIAERAGADSITVHLREDRRHIQNRDVELLAHTLTTAMNLEMAVTEEMLTIAERIRPRDVCLVPEKRQELTTEGGLDVAGNLSSITAAVTRLKAAGIQTSLFIDADETQLQATLDSGARVIEIHTGEYAEATGAHQARELTRIAQFARLAKAEGIQVHAGHGLHYHNVQAIVNIREIEELNIGHAIIARAMMVGLEAAVREMKALMVR